MINGGKIGFLPQDPTLLFNKETLREEFAGNADEIAAAFNLTHLLSRHPFDLSGGERQKAALAKPVSYGADILLLDEPTKAADAVYKQMFSALLIQLKADGKTIAIVSHDMDFCAETADICALLFDGEIRHLYRRHSSSPIPRFSLQTVRKSPKTYAIMFTLSQGL